MPRRYAPARSPLPHVFILGAGFSKAISETMPTLDQLGERIVGKLGRRPSLRLLPKAAQRILASGGIPFEDVEAWLSTLANPAPFVTEAEGHFNAGIFSEIASVIGDEIDLSESEVLSTEASPPQWLEQLIRLWNGVGATLITFNYDTLVEHGATVTWPNGDRWPYVAFNLLKVHGSTSWWRARGDTSAQIGNEELLPGWGVTGATRQRVGYERVLVPPVATKGSYYEPLFIRQQWEEARLAMEQATRLFIVGYRLPENDLATTLLIGQHLARSAEVTLVNWKPEGPLSVLKKLRRPAKNVLDSNDCVKSGLLADYQQIVGTELLPTFVAKLKDVAGDAPAVGIVPDADLSSLHSITSATRETGRLILVAEEPKFDWSPARERIAIRVSELRRRVENAAKVQNRLVIRCRGVDYPVLSIRLDFAPSPWLIVSA